MSLPSSTEESPGSTKRSSGFGLWCLSWLTLGHVSKQNIEVSDRLCQAFEKLLKTFRVTANSYPRHPRLFEPFGLGFCTIRSRIRDLPLSLSLSVVPFRAKLVKGCDRSPSAGFLVVWVVGFSAQHRPAPPFNSKASQLAHLVR